MFESGSTSYRAIERELGTVASADGIRLTYAHFPTEAGTPGWAVVTVDDSQARPGEVADDCRTCSPRVASFRAARVGDRVGTCTIEEIRAMPHGSGAVFAVGCALGGRARLDVRPLEGGRDAPGHAGDLAFTTGTRTSSRCRARTSWRWPTRSASGFGRDDALTRNAPHRSARS